MCLPENLARFALLEFERGLAGLTDAEARTRVDKADGTQINAVSWVVCHISWHWLSLAASATGDRAPSGLRPFATGPKADAGRLSEHGQGGPSGENIGTSLMHAVLHTWYHLGEIAAVRQVMGLAEVPFVGRMIGSLEWREATAGPEPFPAVDSP